MGDFHTAREFAQFIKGLGFRAFVAGTPGGDGTRGYGFITDAKGERVLSFSMEQGISGNYGPPSRESGTGWRIADSVYCIKDAENVRRLLNSHPPDWIRRAGSDGRGGWKYFTTLKQHLGSYGSSSKYKEI